MPDPTSDPTSTPPASNLPAAVPVRRRRLPFAWLLPFIGLGVVGYFAYWTYSQNEPNVKLHLQNAAGIKAFQTPVLCRGVEVGTVIDVTLDAAGEGATVDIRLEPSGLSLATTDSEWWVIRPEFSLTDIRGVESLLAGPSIEYRPGVGLEARPKSFEALNGPPAEAGMRGGMRLFLTAEHRQTIEPGTLIRFRGVPIGRIVSLRLPTHGQTVVFIAEIDLPYTHLIRDNSVFWHRKHATAEVHSKAIGLGGFDIEFPRLNTALDVSIEVATPRDPGETVQADTIFNMGIVPPEKFEAWAPDLTPTDELSTNAASQESNSAASAEDPDQPKPEENKPDPIGDLFDFINPFN